MQPATTAIDPGARPQTMLTVLTQKPPFSTGNLRLLILAAPARLQRELNFANFNNEVAPWCWTIVCMFQIKSGGYPKVSDPTEGSIEPRSLLELALVHSLPGLLRGDFDVPARSNTACLKSGGKFCSHASRTCPCLGRCEGRRGGSALTSRHQLPYALMYEDNPDP
jgi:hypothetical protein